MPKKILVIDDEELVIRSLSKLLGRNGFEVSVVKSGQDALVIIKEEEFDLIISDIRMPGMNGIESVKWIYEFLIKKGAKNPPVIFITGYADEKLEKEAIDLNPVSFIYKPFEISDLMVRVKEVLVTCSAK